MNLEMWCLGWNRNPHVPDGGITVARVTPYGAEVRLCRDCLRAWQANDKEPTRE